MLIWFFVKKSKEEEEQEEGTKILINFLINNLF